MIAGRFELEEVVGSGGMASVYRAHDRMLERPVAVKILHEHYVSDEEAVERFQREARSAAQLAHPNIVTVIDRGEDDGRPYIVFEYVEGENLKQLVTREGALPVGTVIDLGIQIAQALEAAHERGVVHRDIKPQNVLLAEEGRVKVTDFGIARSRGTEGLTLTGTIMGTSDYIAPEQAKGEPAGEASDIYSLGVVLYELLTGRVPYEAESPVAVAMRHVHDPIPSVRSVRPEVPPRLDAAVRRALAKEPRDRFASMSDLVAELEACRRGDVPVAHDSSATVIVPPVARQKPRRAAPRAAHDGDHAARGRRRRRSGGRRLRADQGCVEGDRHRWRRLVRRQGCAAHAVSPPTTRKARERPASTTPRRRLPPTGIRRRTGRPRSTSGALNKSGVGVVLDAGSLTKVRTMTVDDQHAGLHGRDSCRRLQRGCLRAGVSEQDGRPHDDVHARRKQPPLLRRLDHEPRPEQRRARQRGARKELTLACGFSLRAVGYCRRVRGLMVRQPQRHRRRRQGPVGASTRASRAAGGGRARAGSAGRAAPGTRSQSRRRASRRRSSP